ncbi:MAG: peptidylprolyl isomerase [Planctomycetes bacterium]|nr:peptidylprolyl isomerase [Planctomycetota bacterium]
MTQNVPPRPEGQITPSSIELFWETHRQKVMVILTLLVVALAVNYGIQYYQRLQHNKKWSEFNQSAGLDKGYAVPGDLLWLLEQNQGGGGQMLQFYVGNTQLELLTGLAGDLKDADQARLEQELQKARGTPQEPLVLWLMANREVAQESWDAARKHLEEIQARFPKHFLTQESEYPVQYRFDRNAKKNREAAATNPTTKPAKPDLAPSVQGSAVALLLRHIESTQKFRSEHARLYQAPEPDPLPVAVVKTSLGEFKIRFYKAKAPKHVDNFVAKAKEGFFNGVRIDEVVRQGQGSLFASQTPAEFHLGLSSTKGQDDRTLWNRSEPSKTLLDFESNDLSHFPGMVAATPEGEGKSSGERVWINVTDAALAQDGGRVIFGRVVEGLDVLKAISEAPFSTEDENRAGRGRPLQNIEIESITIVEN